MKKQRRQYTVGNPFLGDDESPTSNIGNEKDLMKVSEAPQISFNQHYEQNQLLNKSVHEERHSLENPGETKTTVQDSKFQSIQFQSQQNPSEVPLTQTTRGGQEVFGVSAQNMQTSYDIYNLIGLENQRLKNNIPYQQQTQKEESTYPSLRNDQTDTINSPLKVQNLQTPQISHSITDSEVQTRNIQEQRPYLHQDTTISKAQKLLQQTQLLLQQKGQIHQHCGERNEEKQLSNMNLNQSTSIQSKEVVKHEISSQAKEKINLIQKVQIVSDLQNPHILGESSNLIPPLHNIKDQIATVTNDSPEPVFLDPKIINQTEQSKTIYIESGNSSIIFEQQKSQKIKSEQQKSPLQQSPPFEQLRQQKIDINNDQEPKQDFEFQFTIKQLSKQQREEQFFNMQKIWENIANQTELNLLTNVMCRIMIGFLKQSKFSFLDSNLQQFRKTVIHDLEKALSQDFIQCYEDIFNYREQTLDWETVLLINFGFQQNEISLEVQDVLVNYLRNRKYKNDNEIILLMMVAIIKMEPSQIKTEQLSKLYHSMNVRDTYSLFFVKLIWISLKMFPKFTTPKNFQSITQELIKNQLFQSQNNYFISLLILNAINSGFFTLELLQHSNTFNHLGFLESQAFRFQIKLPGQFYYNLALHCVDKQKPKVGLEFSKYAIDLGFTQAQQLRDQLIRDIFQQQQSGILDKDKQKQQQNTSGGFLGSVKQVFKNIAPNTPKQEEKSDFYYDHKLKGWVINGQLAQDEELKQDVQQDIPLPPKPVDVQKFDQNPVNILPPKKEQVNLSEKPASQTSQNQSPQLPTQQPVICANPFLSSGVSQNYDPGKLKKSNLMRNRYVQ